jgi:hypothetical protein
VPRLSDAIMEEKFKPFFCNTESVVYQNLAVGYASYLNGSLPLA